MNKVNILSIVFAGICAFSACTDDKDPVINDLKDSEGNNISFILNAPNNSSYTLMPENASSIIDIFTCEQPDYGFAAGVTYTVQVCEGGTAYGSKPDFSCNCFIFMFDGREAVRKSRHAGVDSVYGCGDAVWQ